MYWGAKPWHESIAKINNEAHKNEFIFDFKFKINKIKKTIARKYNL
jgi:hypothetical protein